MIELIEKLFWLGFIIAVASFVFTLVFYIIITIVSVIIVGIVHVFRFIAGSDRES